MNPITIVNAVANVVIVATVVDMAIRVFGHREHRIHQHRELFWIRKAISSVVICGAVLNVATLSTPTWTETLLNVGFALNYCFSSFYDRFTRTPNPKNAGTLPKRNTPSRVANTGKSKPSASSRRSGRKRPPVR
jgi:hypothetical protein